LPVDLGFNRFFEEVEEAASLLVTGGNGEPPNVPANGCCKYYTQLKSTPIQCRSTNVVALRQSMNDAQNIEKWPNDETRNTVFYAITQTEKTNRQENRENPDTRLVKHD